MTKMDRSRFLRGQWHVKTAPLRPPWSVEDSRFVESCEGCLRCGDCITVCPENILVSGPASFPVVDFSRGGCSFCGKCAEACPAGVFRSTAEQPWALKANIKESCVSMKGVECRSCGESCEAEAIAFRLVVGGVAQPQITDEACTGCGECVAICPVGAISILKTEKNP